MQNPRKQANPTHLLSVCQNTHYSIFSLKTTQPEVITDAPDFFGKCANFLRPFDHVQVIREDDQVIIEYIIKSIDPVNLKAQTIKLSKIDLVKEEVVYYSYVHTEEITVESMNELPSTVPVNAKLVQEEEDED